MLASIRDSLPFFLGAVAGDHAEKHQQLRAARRQLRRAQTTLEAARAEASEYDSQIQGLLAEAFTSGLVDIERAPSSEDAVRVLQDVLETVPAESTPTMDLQSQNRRRNLKDERSVLRTELGRLLDERAVLLESSATEGGYDAAIAQQLQRLRSVNLLPTASISAEICPVCSQTTTDRDPTASQLRSRLSDLKAELETMAAVHPGRQKALSEISSAVERTRERLISVESAIEADDAVTAEAGPIVDSGRKQFVRGRIDATVGRLSRRQGDNFRALSENVDTAARRVDALERELDDYAARERLTSALISLGRDMTAIAQELRLENSETGVRLDLSRLTVVTDTMQGSVPLSGLGSGANWLGYHLATHLALHRTFVTQNLPMPRLLMLDQPTQVFYESKPTDTREALSESGQLADEDHEAVARMFRLLLDFVEELAPNFQIIVSDHAHLTEKWFEDAVEHNWRGEALIPADWLD
ncbi:hypothetical protein GCM10027403_08460 [Arthrobacter tecti]